MTWKCYPNYRPFCGGNSLVSSGFSSKTANTEELSYFHLCVEKFPSGWFVIIVKMITTWWWPSGTSQCFDRLLYPRSTEGGKGVYWIHPDVCPSVCPSVRPSVGKVSATFRKNYWLNSFHTWDLYLWGKSLDPYRFSCSCPHFWPSGGQKLTENRGFRNFSRKLSARFISSLGFILMG